MKIFSEYSIINLKAQGNPDNNNKERIAMDIRHLGESYLLEAQKIQGRYLQLKEQRASYVGTNFYELDKRIQILYNIYLEMKHTGEYLLHYPGRG